MGDTSALMASAFEEAYGQAATSPLILAQYTAEIQRYIANVPVIDTPMTPQQKQKFLTEFLKGCRARLNGNGITGHALLRAGQVYLKHVMFLKIPHVASYILLGCTWEEAVEFTNRRPNARAFFHIGGKGFRDNTRIEKGLVQANEALTTSAPGSPIYNMAQDYIYLFNPIYSRYRTNPNGAYFLFANSYLDLPNMPVDFMIFIDSIYDSSKFVVEQLFSKFNTVKAYSIHLVMAEIEFSDRIVNPTFEVEYKRNDGLLDYHITMFPMDNSTGYNHVNTNFLTWSKSSHTTENCILNLDPLTLSCGYGLFMVTKHPLTFRYPRTRFLGTGGAVSVGFNPFVYFSSGKIELIIFDKQKQQEFVVFMIANDLDFKKIMNYYRSHLKRLAVGKVLLESEWSFWEENEFAVVAFSILEASLQKHQLGNAMKEIGRIIKDNAKAYGIWQTFVKRVTHFVTTIPIINRKNLLDVITRLRSGLASKRELKHSLDALLADPAPILAPLPFNWFNLINLYYYFGRDDGYGGETAMTRIANAMFGSPIPRVPTADAISTLLDLDKSKSRVYHVFTRHPEAFVPRLVQERAERVFLHYPDLKTYVKTSHPSVYSSKVMLDRTDHAANIDYSGTKQNCALYFNSSLLDDDFLAKDENLYDYNQAIVSILMNKPRHALVLMNCALALGRTVCDPCDECDRRGYVYDDRLPVFFQRNGRFHDFVIEIANYELFKHYKVSISRPTNWHPLSYDYVIIFEKRGRFGLEFDFQFQRRIDAYQTAVNDFHGVTYQNWLKFSEYYETNKPVLAADLFYETFDFGYEIRVDNVVMEVSAGMTFFRDIKQTVDVMNDISDLYASLRSNKSNVFRWVVLPGQVADHQRTFKDNGIEAWNHYDFSFCFYTPEFDEDAGDGSGMANHDSPDDGATKTIELFRPETIPDTGVKKIKPSVPPKPSAPPADIEYVEEGADTLATLSNLPQVPKTEPGKPTLETPFVKAEITKTDDGTTEIKAVSVPPTNIPALKPKTEVEPRNVFLKPNASAMSAFIDAHLSFLDALDKEPWIIKENPYTFGPGAHAETKWMPNCDNIFGIYYDEEENLIRAYWIKPATGKWKQSKLVFTTTSQKQMHDSLNGEAKFVNIPWTIDTVTKNMRTAKWQPLPKELLNLTLIQSSEMPKKVKSGKNAVFDEWGDYTDPYYGLSGETHESPRPVKDDICVESTAIINLPTVNFEKQRAISWLLKERPDLYYCPIPADGFCVWYAVAGLTYGCCEAVHQIKSEVEAKHKKKGGYPFFNKMKLSTTEAKALCSLYKLPLRIITKVDGKFVAHFTNYGAKKIANWGEVVLYDMDDGVKHADIVLYDDPRPDQGRHPYVARPKPHALPSEYAEVNYMSWTDEPQDAFKTMKTAIAKTGSVHLKLNDWLNKINYARCKAFTRFILGLPGTGKTVSVEDRFVDLINAHIKSKALAQLCTKISFVTSVSAIRHEMNKRVTERVRAANPGVTLEADKVTIINTHFAVFEYAVANSKLPTVAPGAVEEVYVDEALRFTAEHLALLINLFSKARFTIIGDFNQLGAALNKNEGVQGLHESKQVFAPYVANKKANWISYYDVSFRFGPLTVRLNNMFNPEFGLKCHSFKFGKVVVGEQIQVQSDGKGGHETLGLVLEEYKMGELDYHAATVSASQGMSVENVVFYPSDTTFNTLRTFVQNRNVAFTRHKSVLNIKLVKGQLLPPLDAGVLQNLYLFTDYRRRLTPKATKYGGIDLPNSKIDFENLTPDEVGGYWLNPKKKIFEEAQLDYDLAKETAMWGRAYPDTATRYKYSKLQNRKRTCEWRDFDYGMFLDQCHFNPVGFSNYRESMQYHPETAPRFVYFKGHFMNLERARASFTSWINGKIHYSASTTQHLMTVTGRMAKHDEVLKHQARAFAGLNLRSIQKWAANRFMETYIDKEKLNSLMTAKVVEEEACKAWNEYTHTMKMTKDDGYLTMAKLKDELRAHLKKQVKAKGPEAAFANKGGQPILAHSKAINLIFSTMVRLTKAMLIKSLKPEFLFASGYTVDEIQAHFSKYFRGLAGENDFVEFDASRSNVKKAIYGAICKVFMMDDDIFDMMIRTQTDVVAFAKEFIVFVKQQLPSGTPDTLFQNTIVNMFLIASMFDSIKGGMFTGDDSSLYFDKIPVPNKWFVDKCFLTGLKFVIREGCTEFCNTWFGPEAATYSLVKLYEKISGNVAFTEIKESKEMYDEHRQAVRQLLQQYLTKPREVIDLTAMRLGIHRSQAEIMWQQMDSYNQLPFSIWKLLPFDEYTVDDFGGRQTSDSETNFNFMSQQYTPKKNGNGNGKEKKGKSNQPRTKGPAKGTPEAVKLRTQLSELRAEFKKLKNESRNPRSLHTLNPRRALESQVDANFLRDELRAKANERKHIGWLLTMWFDPEDAIPVRPGTSHERPTALRVSKNSFTPQISEVGTNGTMSRIFLFRHPLRCVVAEMVHSGFTYKLNGRRMINEADVVPNAFNLYLDYSATLIGTAQSFQFDSAIWTQGTKVHGNRLYPLLVENDSVGFFFYMDGLTELQIDYEITATSASVSIETFKLVNGHVVSDKKTVISAGTVNNYVIAAAGSIPGYYGFKATVTAVTSGTGSWKISPKIVSADSGLHTWGHFSATDVDLELPKMGKTRGLAGSIRMTNTTNALNLDGLMTAAQTSGNNSWIDIATSSTPFDDVRLMEGALQPAMGKHGCYLPILPQDEDDFDFHQVADRNQAGLNWAGIPLATEEDFLVLIYKCASASQLTLTYSNIYEYQSTSQTADVKPPVMDMVVVEKAVKRLKSIPRYYENPTHMKEVAKWVSDAVNKGYTFLKRWAPVIYEVGQIASALV